MKKLCILFFLFNLIGFPLARGQSETMSFIDFRCDETDLTANSHGTEKIDLNGDTCALIKIATTYKDFNVTCGSSTVPRAYLEKPGEIWVYVPYGIRKLEMGHDKLGKIEYSIPIPIEKAKTYKVTLSTKNVAEIETAASAQVTLQASDGVEIFMEGKSLGLRQWTGTLKRGDYSVECRKANCYPSITEIPVYATKGAKLTFDLKTPLPIMSSLSITTIPAGVQIWVDGEKIGTSPKTISVSVGSHRVKLQRDGYATKELTAYVEQGKTKSVNETLSQFVNININLLARKNKCSRKVFPVYTNSYNVFVDGKAVGSSTTPVTTRVLLGQHTIKGSIYYDGRRYKGTKDVVITSSNQKVDVIVRPCGVKPLQELEDIFYLDLSCQVDFYKSLAWGLFASLGGYFGNDVNLETFCFFDLTLKYCGFRLGLKTGYGLQIGSKISLTPQVGLGCKTLSYFIGDYAFTIDAALRFSIGKRLMRFLVIPEYSFVFASNSYTHRSFLKAWRNEFGLRIGFALVYR